jgi:hypothetical protein
MNTVLINQVLSHHCLALHNGLLWLWLSSSLVPLWCTSHRIWLNSILVWKGNLMVRCLIMVQAGYLKLINNDPLKLGQIITITPLLFLRPHRRFSILLQTLRYLSVPAMGALEYVKPTQKQELCVIFLGHSLNLVVHIFIQHSLIVIVAIIMCFQFWY